MARATLDALLRMRRLAVDEAARALGAAIQEAERARQLMARLTDALTHECAVTRALAAEDPAFIPFAAWRARAQQEITQAAARLATTDEAVVAAQDALGAARGAARALETAIERRQAEEEAAALRAAQHTLDEVAQRRTHLTQG
jgi:flagellar FliJ protein